MKKLILLFFLFATLSSKSQTITKKIFQKYVGVTTLVYEQKIKDADTSYSCYIYGNDARYRYLSSKVIILFLEEADKKKFVVDLKKAKEYFEAGTTEDVLFESKFYQIRITSQYGTKKFLLYELKGVGVVNITLREAKKLIDLLETFEIGKIDVKAIEAANKKEDDRDDLYR